MQDNKAVLITGSTDGIGLETARVFAAQGYSVVINGVRAEHFANDRKKLGGVDIAEALSQEFKSHVIYVQADMREPDQIELLVRKTIEKFRRLDAVIANAGILDVASITDHSIESFDQMVAVNLKAPWLLAKYSAKHLADTNGSLIFISSDQAFRCRAMRSVYAMTKKGVLAYVPCLKDEFTDQGMDILVAAIAPWATGDTNMAEKLLQIRMVKGMSKDQAILDWSEGSGLVNKKRIGTEALKLCRREYPNGVTLRLIGNQTEIILAPSLYDSNQLL